MNWIKVIAQDELPENGRKVVKVEQRNILLLNHNNQVFAIENSCPHLKLPLQKGKITDDGAIVCPFHRSAFDLATGNPTTWIPFPPGIGKVMGMISKEKGLSVFPTRIEEGSIWVEV
ncbi:Rieske (2Fe-2S) region [Nostoc sp. NIES-3756]|jgi:nitrite reductase/ring-hydroxylating ferredoxin subunit|uniref:Rieske (2Fe-2S) protein n=1 Tax=Nostoc sp. NIES-3756 TaxID=1751286 RepID=UPI0007228AF1|nr:Rieske (2Fe-2S) protein [Nostoc sp. NIES-3756]BAT51547.1 Rieske (2Fe-2S) region [Nostoc sp. NIES-3756]BAY40732.1 Rieske (2Fe-2S) region [Nostoc sp. NIES-2111]